MLNDPRFPQVATLMSHTIRADGECDSYWSLSVPIRSKPIQGTPNSTRAKRPSRFIVLYNGSWRRVYLDMTTPTQSRPFIGRSYSPDRGEVLRIASSTMPA